MKKPYLTFMVYHLLSVPALPPRGLVVKNVLYGEVPPEGHAPYAFIYHFWQKRYPFRIPSIDKWYPLHIISLGLSIPFNFCKSTVFEI